MHYLFRIIEDAQAPHLPVYAIVGLIASLLVILKYLKYPKLFAVSAILLQIVMMYWYIKANLIISIGLPLYHCRIILWAVSIGLLFNLRSQLLVWFSLLGVPASLAVLIISDMHHYQFPHITNIYYWLSHSLIFLICMHYLQRYYVKLNWQRIVTNTLILHLLIQIANVIFKANYAYLMKLPLINYPILNTMSFVIMTIGISLVVILMNLLVEKTSIMKQW